MEGKIMEEERGEGVCGGGGKNEEWTKEEEGREERERNVLFRVG